MAAQVYLREANGRFASVQTLINKLLNPQPLLQAIGKLLKDSAVARVTTTKISPDGRPFAPWSLATYNARLKKGTIANGILFDTGNMARSITAVVADKKVMVGVDENQAPYAKYLQNGTSKMPARPFIGISQQDNTAVRTAVQTYLSKGKTI